MSTKKIDAEIEALRAKLAAAEAEREAEAKKEQTAIAKAKKHAGDSHTRTMIALYELLGIEPEHGTTRVSRGKSVQVAADRDEKVRSQRLFTAVESLVEAADEDVLARLHRDDEEGREERRPQPKVREADAAGELDDEPQHQSDDEPRSTFSSYAA